MNNTVHIGILLLFSFTLFASGPDLERDDLVVSVRSPRTVVPGQFETFILEVSNDYDHPLDLQVRVDMPPSWRIISPINNIHLEPGEKKAVVFLVDIDRACETGDKNLLFQFYDKDRAVRIEKRIVTSVENVRKLDVRAIRYPDHLTSGEEYEVDFIIRNLGNCYENLMVSSEQGMVSTPELVMPPNSTRQVKVTARALDLQSLGYSGCDLVLQTDSAEKPLKDKVSIRTFPKVTKRTDPYQRFPVNVSLIYFGARNNEEFRDGYQFEVDGRGYLDRDRNHHLYFKARGPSRFSISRVGNFDQYTAEYKWQQSRTRSTTVSLGDFAYNLTPLTEMLRWARGAGVKQNFRRLEVGAFYNQPRFIKEVEQQAAAYATYGFTPDWSLKLSTMYKDFEGDRSAQLVSARNGIKLGEQSIQAEYAFGASNDGTSGSAMNLDLTGGIESLSLAYTSQNVYASGDFPGYYSNSVYSVSNIRYRRRKYAINAGFTYNDANPALDTIRTSSPYSTSASLRFMYLISKDLRMGLSYINRSKEDRFPDKKFSYRENGVRYTTNYSNEFWSFLLDGEVTRTQNLLLDPDFNTATSFNARGSVEGKILRNFQAAAFGQYLYTNRYTSVRQLYLLYGLNLGYRLSNNLSMMGSYRNNYLIDEYNTDRSLIDFRANARFGAHQFSLGFSHALIRNTVDRKDYYVNARYTCHINTPLRKKTGLYSLTGIIKSKAAGDAKGIVLHMAGQSVITNEYGRFEFNDLPPGIHYLHMDMGTIGIGLMTKEETPVEVQIFPKEQNTIDLEIVRSGAIVGKIDFGKPIGKTESGEDKFPLRVIKATSGKREMLTYTDDKGNFSFKRVLPGNWKVRVVENTAAQGEWELDQNNVRVDVNPAETEEVIFTMNKKERKIRFKNSKAIDLKIKKD